MEKYIKFKEKALKNWEEPNGPLWCNPDYMTVNKYYFYNKKYNFIHCFVVETKDITNEKEEKRYLRQFRKYCREKIKNNLENI